MGDLVERLLDKGNGLHSRNCGSEIGPTHCLACEAAARIATLEAQLAEVRGAIEPVRHWYESDEHPPRDLPDILTDIVSDLQNDRKELLELNATLAKAEPGK